MTVRQRPPGDAQPPAVQRLRLHYARRDPVRYLSHLDLMRMFERVCRRAAIPLAYSAGFTPHARISIAAPLGVGILSEAELVDLFLERRLGLIDAGERFNGQLPAGFPVLDIREVPLDAPPLQTLTSSVTYHIECLEPADRARVATLVEHLQSARELPVVRERNDERVHFDLRSLLFEARRLEGDAGLEVTLRLDNEAGARPEDVLLAVGLDPLAVRVVRRRINLADRPVLPGRPVARQVEKLARGSSERDRILRYPETAQ